MIPGPGNMIVQPPPAQKPLRTEPENPQHHAGDRSAGNQTEPHGKNDQAPGDSNGRRDHGQNSQSQDRPGTE